MIRLNLCISVAICLVPITNPCFAQPGPVKTVALTGDPIPGLEETTITNVSQFHSPIIFGDGSTIFNTKTSAGNDVLMTTENVLYSTGMNIPGTPAGTEIAFFGRVVANKPVGGALDIAISAVLSGENIDDTNNQAIIGNKSGVHRLVAQSGEPVLGTSDTSAFFSELRQGEDCDLWFLTSLNSGEDVLQTECDGTIHSVDQTGRDEGAERVVATNTISTNASRRVALYARKWQNVGTLNVRDEVVLSESDGRKQVLIATGQPIDIDGLAVGSSLDEFFAPKTNDADQIVLFGTTSGAQPISGILSFDYTDNTAIVGRFVAEVGGTPPELPNFEFDFFLNASLNEARQVVYSAEISPKESPGLAAAVDIPLVPTQGVWYEDRNNVLQLAGVNGQQAPGLADGVTLQQIGFPTINGLGQVAFKSALGGPSVEFTANEAVWVTNLAGDLELVVRKGDLFDVNDDPEIEDFRTINAIGRIANSGGTGGETTSFNDAGQLALVLNFSDFTSGMFVFDLAPPASAVDLDRDGDVDGADFLAIQRADSSLIAQWQNEYGSGLVPLAASQIVPEPATAMLVVFAFAFVGSLRSSHRMPGDRYPFGNR